MKIILALLIFALMPLCSYSQTEITIKVIDSNQEPIYSVLVYNQNNQLLGHTTQNGELMLTMLGTENSELTFRCIGFESKRLSVKKLKSFDSITLNNMAYEMDDIVVMGYKDSKKIVEDAYKLHKERYKFNIKQKHKFYASAHYAKTVEADGKVIGYRDEYGVLFTTGNTKASNRAITYNRRFTPIYGSYSYELTSDGTDTLMRIANYRYGSDGNFWYDSESMSIDENVIRVIYLDAPIFSDVGHFDFKQIAADSSEITYLFNSKNGIYPKKARSIMRGKITIYKETKRIKYIEFTSLDYVSINRVRNFPNAFINNSQIRAYISYDSNNIAYIRRCDLATTWTQRKGVRISGNTPPRPLASKRQFVIREHFSCSPYKELVSSDTTQFIASYSYLGAGGEYNREFFKNRINPHVNSADLSLLEKYMPLEQQYQRNSYHNRKTRIFEQRGDLTQEERRRKVENFSYAKKLFLERFRYDEN